jgi:hypothetical protein
MQCFRQGGSLQVVANGHRLYARIGHFTAVYLRGKHSRRCGARERRVPGTAYHHQSPRPAAAPTIRRVAGPQNARGRSHCDGRVIGGRGRGPETREVLERIRDPGLYEPSANSHARSATTFAEGPNERAPRNDVPNTFTSAIGARSTLTPIRFNAAPAASLRRRPPPSSR